MAWDSTWRTEARGSISSTHSTPPRLACRWAKASPNWRAISGVSAAPASRTTWVSGSSCSAARTRWIRPFCRVIRPTKTTDGRSRSMPRPVDDVGAGVRRELVGVDAVLDHVHLVGVQVGVGLQDVRAHPGADRDHRVGGLEGGPLGPRRQLVAAAELLGLPRPVRFERVGAHHVRDAVQQPGQVPGQVGVPGVGVHQVDLGDRRHHRQVGAEDPQRGVRPRRVGLGVRRGALPRLAHALHVDVDQLAQLRHQLGHVDARRRRRSTVGTPG